MPDLLLISQNTKSQDLIDHLSQKLKFRVKIANTLTRSLEWIQTAKYDLVLVEASFGNKEIAKVAECLWRHFQNALMVAYDLEGNIDDAWDLYLSGAEKVDGPQALNDLEKIMQSISQKKFSQNKDVNVLVVEDLDAPRDIICALVERLGYPNVEGVSGASKALELLKQDPQKYTCVITDINMPNLNGQELIDLIRNNNKTAQIPVVVITAYGTVDCLVDCLEAGASGFLVKPPSRVQLTKELARAVRIKSTGSDPRLMAAGDSDALREILIEKGFLVS